MSIMETVKEHPVAVGAAVLVVILLVMRSGGSGNSGIGANIAASLESQRIASGTNTQLSAIAADVVKANTAAYTQQYIAGVEAAADMSKASHQSDLAIMTQWMQARQNEASIDASRAVGMANIDAGKIVALDTNATQIRLQADQIEGARVMTNTLVHADAWRRADQMASDQQFLSFQSAGLQTMLQAEQNLAHLSAGTAVVLNQIEADKLTNLADISARTTLSLADIGSSLQREKMMQAYELEKFALQNQRRKDNVNSWVKASESANNGALKWMGMYGFSDARLKDNIVFTGHHSPRGFRLYSYTFKGSNTLHVGVMAQEVAAADPSAVRECAGFLMVDYSKV